MFWPPKGGQTSQRFGKLFSAIIRFVVLVLQLTEVYTAGRKMYDARMRLAMHFDKLFEVKKQIYAWDSITRINIKHRNTHTHEVLITMYYCGCLTTRERQCMYSIVCYSTYLELMAIKGINQQVGRGEYCR